MLKMYLTITVKIVLIINCSITMINADRQIKKDSEQDSCYLSDSMFNEELTKIESLIKKNKIKKATRVLNRLIEDCPDVKFAPKAVILLLDCLLEKKEYDLLYQKRILFLQNYGTDSKWYSNKMEDSEFLFEFRKKLKEIMWNAASFVCFDCKDSKYKTNSIFWYNKFIEEFSEDSTRVLEAHDSLGDLYMWQKCYKKAAYHYNIVADIDSIPEK